METIFALSSGAPPAGVAVIRICGPRSREVLEAMAGSVPPARRMCLRMLRDGTGEPIDEALVVWLPAPGSFAGEDCAELHCHGSRAVVLKIFESLAERDGVRAAEAGEFTRRAFLNGRLDLTEAEGLADLIAAETEAQRCQALAQAEGAMARRLAQWRERLRDLLAEVEARLDFADEEDAAEELGPEFWKELRQLLAEVESVLAGSYFAERIREGFTIVLTGAPNVGKSTLLNAFARREVAIVSDEPGTTRDLVTVPLSLGGYAVTLVDTAGLRSAASAAEMEGVRRARLSAENADLVLRLTEGGNAGCATKASEVNVWRVETKADISGEPHGRIGDAAFRVSAKSGVGLEELEGAIGDWLRGQLGGRSPGTGAEAVNGRQRTGLQALRRGIESVLEREGMTVDELTVEELRSCVTSIGRIAGRVDAEEMLGAIFSRFCIGK
ncbi:tRNA uridine-5-carboxymethylaminomethyl(34) synthesis GTPase MnmE [Afifella pfennigii]|uniref:tRNA uridine-5-carboxymethylaminomethyl(34) synthesis GTPase MnmE n=1 Tax=Afifella pfennigii TaxID=209897 RepID=UPI00047E4FD2|nr:tRNA uridine-5-carboxymethylaminomethyl(34) synthesis GTPase MnmE [Afifella pfennigii]